MSCNKCIALSLSAASAFVLFHRPIMESMSYKLNQYLTSYIKANNPNRIIIIRHGESTANLDENIYKTIPDNKVPLTNKGKEEAVRVGKKLKQIIKNESVRFYVSPYLRAIQTYDNIYKSFNNNKTSCIIDPRLREQEFGNFYVEDTNAIKYRYIIGKFYYRFNQGESGSDCYDRLTMFKDRLFKDCGKNSKSNRIENVIIICHGITMRLFLMNFFNMSINQFHNMALPKNCSYFRIEKNKKNKYELMNKIKYF